ncbi:MAG: methylamine utilization protein MauJ [Terracidiphilus sp.]|jgi:hypothetical protein
MNENTSATSASQSVAEQQATIRLPVLGFPGEPYSMVLTNIYKDPDSHLNRVPPQGLPGQYKVSFVMGKPEHSEIPEREIKFAEFMRGDSHLAILAPAFPAPGDAIKIHLALRVGSESLVVEGTANEEGYLSKLETQPFFAQNRNDAQSKAVRIVHGLLSEYSVQLDIPLQADLIEVTEISTANRSLTLVAPFLGGGTSAPIVDYDQEFANLCALYREGMLSKSPVYRYLCFYKILEASRKRRERLGRKHKKAYQPIRHGEIIPASVSDQITWLTAIFIGPRQWPELMLGQIFPPETHGKKITALFDGNLRRLRDRIAHGILDSGQYLLVDDPDEVREIGRWLPFLRCAVRRILKNDFPGHYLTYLKEDGSINHEMAGGTDPVDRSKPL